MYLHSVGAAQRQATRHHVHSVAVVQVHQFCKRFI
jgi:hypothetical protein